MEHITQGTKIVVTGPKGPITTTLGAAMIAAGLSTPAVTPASSAPAKRKTQKPALAPASADELVAQLKGLAPAEKPSVIVDAKQSARHSDVTIYITKEFIPGDTREYLCIARTRTAPDGTIGADTKQNFGFDKSYCYYGGPKPADAAPAAVKWPLKKEERTVDGVKGTFWCRYVPIEAIESMLTGLRTNFAGATLSIDGKTTVL